MIERIDYTKYLSYDNGKGLLINSSDVFILEKYGIDYANCIGITDLIFQISEVMESGLLEEDMEDLIEVLSHLNEMHYYYETKK